MTSHGYSSDSEDYSTPSEDYSWPSEGHSSQDWDHRAKAEADADAKTKEEPWWRKAGYSSLAEFGEEQDRLWESWGYRVRPRPGGMPETVLPRAELPIRGRTRDPRMRQVNVRLRNEIYEELEKTAGDYGVKVSTMAGMLVNNGVLLARRARERGEI
jgi:hypothetical protein